MGGVNRRLDNTPNKPTKPNAEDLGKDRPGTSWLQKKTPGVGVVRPTACATD